MTYFASWLYEAALLLGLAATLGLSRRPAPVRIRRRR